MGAEHRLVRAVLQGSHRTFIDNIHGLTLGEALDAAGGYRSILGMMKHVAGWSAVYHSYAVEDEPRHWNDTDWPRGLRDTVDTSEASVREIVAWFHPTYERWLSAVAEPADLDQPKPLHWGGTAPFREIVGMVAAHWNYHAGEINMILALRRQEAWGSTEEVEENHISTVGHRVRPAWMTEQDALDIERR